MPTPDWNKRYVAGKGSWRRPEDAEKFRRGHDRIFGETCHNCAKFNGEWCQFLRRYLRQDDLNHPACAGLGFKEVP